MTVPSLGLPWIVGANIPDAAFGGISQPDLNSFEASRDPVLFEILTLTRARFAREEQRAFPAARSHASVWRAVTPRRSFGT